MSDPDEQDLAYQPNKIVQSLFDVFKFWSVIVYQMSLCFTLAYYRSSNFSSVYLLNMFLIFLVARPLAIFLYTSFVTSLNWHESVTKMNKLRRIKLKEINARSQQIVEPAGKTKDPDNQLQSDELPQVEYDVNDDIDELHTFKGRKLKAEQLSRFEHPEIATINELIINFVCLPIVIYSGFGRLIYSSERKYSLVQASVIQEIFLHCLPLDLIIYYNISSLGK